MSDKGSQDSKRLWTLSSSNSFWRNQWKPLTVKRKAKSDKIPELFQKGTGRDKGEKKCSSAYLSMRTWGLWFTQEDVKPLCFSFTYLPLMNTKRASLSSFVYFYFLVPGDRIPQIPPFVAAITFRAQKLEHSHAQKEWSTNAEVGHVRKHLRLLETTTSKDHSPHDDKIKARWGSGLSFKYSWGYKRGRR